MAKTMYKYRYNYRDAKHPAMIFMLRGLLPYTNENVLLSFKPSTFFYEMSKVSGHSEAALRNAYYRARKQDLFSGNKIPRLTEKGLRKIAPFVAKKLGKDARLIVIFDIPEHRVAVRHSFRSLLKNLGFTMIQQSVWVTDTDHRKIVIEAIRDLGIETCVEVHESLRLFPK
jgi:DNA-binding transcriptional regulator PaaX